MDPAELDFIIADTPMKNPFVTKEDVYLSNRTKLGTIVCYLEGKSPQYAHLRYSMLAYVSINLLTMKNKFPDTACSVATDSFYINREIAKDLLALTDDSGTYGSSWGSWRIKDEQLHGYCESADVEIKDNYCGCTNPEMATKLLTTARVCMIHVVDIAQYI